MAIGLQRRAGNEEHFLVFDKGMVSGLNGVEDFSHEEANYAR